MHRLLKNLKDKLYTLNQSNIRRVEFDFHTWILYLDSRAETAFRGETIDLLLDYIQGVIREILSTTTPDQPVVRNALQSIRQRGWVKVESRSKLLQQADFAFGQETSLLPPLVGEVA